MTEKGCLLEEASWFINTCVNRRNSQGSHSVCDNMSRKTVDAIILSHAPNVHAYFAYTNQVSRDLIISYNFIPPGNDLLGKWIKAEVRDPNCVFQPTKLINDLFETRVINNIPEIKVEAVYDGRYEDKFNVFFHRYFGIIFDNASVIRNVEKNQPYSLWITRLYQPNVRARWRISAKQHQCHSDNLRTVRAIVHSLALDGRRYLAWSEAEPRDKISIDVDKVPPTPSLLGRWIEVTIDSINCVVGAVQIIPDVFETRVRFGMTEVLANFEDTDNSSVMLYSSYFGNIYDVNQMIYEIKKNSWYRGWIVFFYKAEIDTRWRIAKGQTVEGPFIIERYLDQHYPNDRRNSWYENDERPSRNQAADSSQNRDHFNNYPMESYNTPRHSYGTGSRHNYDGSHSMEIAEPEKMNETKSIPVDNPDRNRPSHQEMANFDYNRPLSPSSQRSSSNINQRNQPENESINHVHSPENASKGAVVVKPESTSSSSKLRRIAKRDRATEETNLLKLKTDLARMSHLVQSLTKDCSVTEIMKSVNSDGYEELMKLTASK